MRRSQEELLEEIRNMRKEFQEMKLLQLKLITKDKDIVESGLVETIWV